MYDTKTMDPRARSIAQRRQAGDTIKQLAHRLGPVKFGAVQDTNMSRDELICALRWAVHTAPSLRIRATDMAGAQALPAKTPAE